MNDATRHRIAGMWRKTTRKPPPPSESMRTGMSSQQRARKKQKLMRSNPRCYWCLCKLTYRMATIDHVLPLSLGGTSADENLVLACYECNQAKGNAVWTLNMKGHRAPKAK